MTYLGLKTCPQCDGTGECAYEEPVVDYQHGGYLQEVIDTCDRCGGSGEIEDWEDDDNE
jgi:DnaJ-class molecular chaperone